MLSGLPAKARGPDRTLMGGLHIAQRFNAAMTSPPQSRPAFFRITFNSIQRVCYPAIQKKVLFN
jgi:hypothetical protein